MVFVQQDYRSILKTVMAAKGDGREGLSLRSLAAKLDVSTSFLSEVISAKKSLSVDLACKIAIRLNFTALESQYFCLLVQLEQEKDPVFREKLLERLNELNPRRKSHDLSADLFRSISEWHHGAILEMTYLQAPLTAESVATRLGIPKIEAELALERLLRLELLEADAKGRLRKSHNHIQTESKIPVSAFKKFHGQILSKASGALQTFTPSERMSATDVVAIDSKYLSHVSRLSEEFSAAVLKLAERSKFKDNVYALSVHFFPLLKPVVKDERKKS